jgi:hypothetical protein
MARRWGAAVMGTIMGAARGTSEREEMLRGQQTSSKPHAQPITHWWPCHGGRHLLRP